MNSAELMLRFPVTSTTILVLVVIFLFSYAWWLTGKVAGKNTPAELRVFGWLVVVFVSLITLTATLIIILIWIR